MSAAQAPKPAKTNPRAAAPANAAGRRPAAPRVQVGTVAAKRASDMKMILAGMLLLALLGYVGYRTQVRGETLAEIIPFLGTKQTEAPTDTPNDPAKSTYKPGTLKPAKPAEEENTLFGRRHAAPAN